MGRNPRRDRLAADRTRRQAQGPPEGAAANSVLKAVGIGMEPGSTTPAPTTRIRDDVDTPEGGIGTGRIDDHSQKFRPAIPLTAPDTGSYGHAKSESSPVGTPQSSAARGLVVFARRR